MSSAGGGLLTFVPVPVAVATWLRKHGKAVRPELTNQQRVELKECFNLIDSDGSGAIGAGELMDAFRFMGIKITRPELKSILDEVDRDGSGEVEYAEFVEIMTCSLERFSSRSNDDEEVAAPLPFPLLATAYRRRKLLEAMFSGDSEKRNRMTDQANRAMAEVEQLKQQSEERLARKKRVTKSAGSRPAGSVVLNSFGDAVDHQGETWRRDREPFGKGYTCPPIKKNGPGQRKKPNPPMGIAFPDHQSPSTVIAYPFSPPPSAAVQHPYSKDGFEYRNIPPSYARALSNPSHFSQRSSASQSKASTPYSSKPQTPLADLQQMEQPELHGSFQSSGSRPQTRG
ncbi:hypothetical protein CYMTET_12834 [Cymbomonas tetramitiformis]|uniref:Caltractin n=1 Tax=Cymbomonas tetramitiformis TaxID=36881 RepID=A0AAE0LBF9_9CHLO|nr:hypothetical protein CYMTET_12834 [Cymbomonas tetramitiformis]